MKHSHRLLKYAFVLLAMLASSASFANDSTRVLSERVLQKLGQNTDQIRLIGFTSGETKAECALSVISDSRVGLYEVRLATVDGRFDYPLTSAENWDVKLAEGIDTNKVEAIGSAEFSQTIPGLDIRVGTKYVTNKLDLVIDGADTLHVEMQHFVLGFWLGDSNQDLSCDFAL